MADLVTLIREYAEDHYYKASWDIVATQWTDAEIEAAIRGAKTRRGAIAKAWGVLQHIDRARPRWDRPVRPQSLFEFLASNGGLRSDDRLIADVRASIDGNVMVPRFGPLIRQPAQLSTAARMSGRKAPMWLDQAREACVEAGYLFDAGDVMGGEADTTISDLLELIDDEARGHKRYPHGREPYEPMEHYDDVDESDDYEIEEAA